MTVLNLQGKTNPDNRSAHTHFAVQKVVEGNIRYTEWEKYAATNSLYNKAVIQDRKRIKNFQADNK